MSFRLVDTGWDTVLDDAIQKDHSELRIICPFIKHGAAIRLLAHGVPQSMQVITRFDPAIFCAGVSDLSALRLLMENGATIRGVKHLHAKLYLFGGSQVVVTSANLTEAALVRNHEFGFVADDAAIIARCRLYFDDLCGRAGPDLTMPRLATWETQVMAWLAQGARPNSPIGLGDQGVDIGFVPEPVILPPGVAEAGQAFVKFFGESDDREAMSLPVLEEVRGSGSHWACTYPKGKRPRQVKDGAIIFMGRMVKDPDDILIYGRAVGMSHVPGRDDASAAEIADRTWKAQWPHYVRVHDAEFVAGILANGVSLNALMRRFQSDSFMATKRNAASGQGNTDPRRAYRQQPSVELTPEAADWLNSQLQGTINRFGRLPTVDLATLDWPAVPQSQADTQ
jgi:hypothetical protein